MDEKPKTGKHSKGNIPRKEADLMAIAKAVLASWLLKPQVVLLWTTSAVLKDALAAFSTSYSARIDVKGFRRSITQGMATVNSEIDASSEQVKNYLVEKFGKKEAPVHYERFGIIKTRGKYRMPVDNDKRQLALDQMIIGLEQYDLLDRKFGGDYWQDLRDRFMEKKTQAKEADKVSAEQIGIKSVELVTIRKILNSLIFAIKANFPDTWKEELRIWGFQKEKY